MLISSQVRDNAYLRGFWKAEIWKGLFTPTHFFVLIERRFVDPSGSGTSHGTGGKEAGLFLRSFGK
jgi:hypothetical protein